MSSLLSENSPHCLFQQQWNRSEMFEASFYLARFYSNLPWPQKHSFSICQKVVLVTLKCPTVIGGWIQNWLLQRSDNRQFCSDVFLGLSYENLKKEKKAKKKNPTLSLFYPPHSNSQRRRDSSCGRGCRAAVLGGESPLLLGPNKPPPPKPLVPVPLRQQEMPPRKHWDFSLQLLLEYCNLYVYSL